MSTKSSSTVSHAKKSHATSGASASAASPEVSQATPVSNTPPVTPPGDLPPSSGAVTAPSDWTAAPGKKRGGKGPHPRGAQISDAVSSANEIVKSPTYVEDFGTRAPSAAGVAFVVTNAAKWRTAWNVAKKGYEYASEQRAAWEADALAQMDALKPAFQYAQARDASLAQKYSATAKYMNEASAIATRAASSRKAAKKAADKGAPAPATSAAPVATAATDAAAPVTAPAK